MPQPVFADQDVLKVCSVCHQAKPTTEYYVHTHWTGQLFARCKDCVKREQRPRNTIANQKKRETRYLQP